MLFRSLKEMMAYWADNNQKALDDLANLERFMAMSWSLKGTDDCYYYGQKDANGLPNGTGIAPGFIIIFIWQKIKRICLLIINTLVDGKTICHQGKARNITNTILRF